MTERDGSKGRASAICIARRHFVWTLRDLPEKMASLCLFQRQNSVTSRCWPGTFGRLQGTEQGWKLGSSYDRDRHGRNSGDRRRDPVRTDQGQEHWLHRG